jgi:hypothetical protein
MVGQPRAEGRLRRAAGDGLPAAGATTRQPFIRSHVSGHPELRTGSHEGNPTTSQRVLAFVGRCTAAPPLPNRDAWQRVTSWHEDIQNNRFWF